MRQVLPSLFAGEEHRAQLGEEWVPTRMVRVGVRVDQIADGRWREPTDGGEHFGGERRIGRVDQQHAVWPRENPDATARALGVAGICVWGAGQDSDAWAQGLCGEGRVVEIDWPRLRASR